jgi:hypothetical protein
MHDTTAISWGAMRNHTPSGGAYSMSAHSIPCRLQTRGNSLFVLLVKEVRNALPWRSGDFVAARVCGEKLILERITLEKLATLRTGELQPQASGAFDP